MKGADSSMSQIFAEQNNQSIAIPHGWSLPKFRLGQPVNVCLRFSTGRDDDEFGVIAGLTYHPANSAPNRDFDGTWEYNVALSPESQGWRVYGGILIAQEDELSAAGVFDSTCPALTSTSSEHHELVLR